jgi:hypothetical protein
LKDRPPKRLKLVVIWCEAARGTPEITEKISGVTQTVSVTSYIIVQTHSESTVLEKWLQNCKNWQDN